MGEPRRTTRSQPRDSIAVRLGAFAALASFAATQWIALVADPPVGRAALAVGAGVAGAVALALIARASVGRASAWALAVVASLLAVAAAAFAIGVPARLLAPGAWGELRHNLTAGLNAIGNNDYPYSGANEWSRLAILFGLPLWLGLAASLAFWPRRRPVPGARIPALVVLVGAYATAATVNPPAMPLWHGLVLLVLVAAWLWLPGLGRRDALAGGALVLAAGTIGLPLAARLDGGHPWFDWRTWNWAWSKDRGRRVVQLGPVVRSARLAAQRQGAARGQEQRPSLLADRGAATNSTASDGCNPWRAPGQGFELPRQAARRRRRSRPVQARSSLAAPDQVHG